MPIPFILAGAAVALGGYGVKKGIDAKDDFDVAKKRNNKAKNIYEEAENKLENEKQMTNKSLEQLGYLKASIYKESLKDFIETFEKIKNIDFNDNLDKGTLKNLNQQDILNIKSTVIEMHEILGGGVAAIGSGAAAGLGALGGVGMLASASTGTAIASLSGAAATNATLAWLGGGALSAGGFGMAGGMAVLGGIVAGPVLAVGGFMMASKAEEAKYTASSNLEKARAGAEQMSTAGIVLNGIYNRTVEFKTVLNPLNKIFIAHIKALEYVVDNGTDYRTYSEENKKLVMLTAAMANTIKNICDAPIIDEEGKVTIKSKEVLKTASDLMKQINKV